VGRFGDDAAGLAPPVGRWPEVVRRDVQSLTRAELTTQMAAWGEAAYRADQLLAWIYPRRAGAWEDLTDLPRSLRARLAAQYTWQCPELVRHQGSRDATQKFLWRLPDHALIESVLIPASPALYGEPSDRHTLCVSTQVGCAYGCRFCASGLLGWKRDLGVEEIVGQVLAVERWHAAASATADSGQEGTSNRRRSSRRCVNNLVIMGMGEPLANYDNLLKALRILNAPWGGALGARKITVSTSGLVPQIERLGREPEQFGLAISLHGATDAVRGRLMPINRRYPLAELLRACEDYQRCKGRKVTLEFVLIAGLNDGLEQAEALGGLARRLRAKVNLIPYNAVASLPWNRPTVAVQEGFLRALERRGVNATLRREKGGDIDAACGQLRLRNERELGTLGLSPTQAAS
jgi:23S rRNA (adenine2503-C2)-methyltransferase